MLYVYMFVLIILVYKHTQSGVSVGCAAGRMWPSHTEVQHKTEILNDMLNLRSEDPNGI